MKLSISLLVVATAMTLSANADRIKLTSGREMQGVAERQEDGSVKIRTKGGTVSLPADAVSSIEKTPESAVAQLPKWDDFMAAVVATKWGMDARQIPATVIDNGVMKYVPYMSYQAGNYEINIYGDAENPACVEVGIRNDLLKSDVAKDNCLAYMSAILKNDKLRSVIKNLNKAKDTQEVDGITLEVTPESDPDAYGGWWVSAYSIRQLDASRATAEELAKITVKRNSLAIANSEKANASANLKDSVSRAWTADDLGRARTTTGSQGGGSVYVSGYTRKDGAYVHSYTRSSGGRR